MRGRPLAVFLLASLATGMDARAQEPDAVNRVGGMVEAELRVTRLAGSTGLIAGASVGLGVASSMFVTGEGSILLGDIQLEHDGSTNRLGFGYGGVGLRYLFESSSSWTLGLGLLAGAGRARSKDTSTGIELGAKNVFVLRPRAVTVLPLYGPLYVGVALGYRWVWGFDDLTGISAGELSSPTASVSLRALRRE